MAYKTSLALYHLRLQRRHDSEYQVLSRLKGGTIDLLDVLHALMIGRQSTIEASADTALFTQEIDVDASRRALYGIVKSGQYGTETEIVNVQTGRHVYRKKKSDADMLPFYFQLRIKPGADEAQLVLQRNGNLGIFTVMKRILDGHLRQQFPDLVMELSPIIPEEVIEKRLRKAKVTKVRFVKFGRHPDMADFYAAEDHKEFRGTMELVVSAGRNKHFDFGKLVLRRAETIDGRKFIELRDFEYDTMKVECEFDGQRQTVDLDIGTLPRAYYQVDGEVQKGPSGFPTVESVHKAANKLLRQLEFGLHREAT